MTNRTLSVLMTAALILAGAANASAQTPRPQTTNTPSYELSAGYQFLHVPEMNFPFGLAIDGALHRGTFGLVAEGGWAVHSDEDEAVDVEFSTNMWHLAAGARFTGFSSRPLWPYAQVLVGAAIAHSSIDFGGDDDSDTETSFMVQPGFGVTLVAGDGWGVFGQVDYRRTFFDEPDGADPSVNNQFRIFIGARMILD
jgi:hypothetical protein